MTTKVFCDRCKKEGGAFGYIKWLRRSGFGIGSDYKDICKTCMMELFPEWIK